MPHVSPRPVDGRTLQEVYNFLFSALTSKNISTKQQRQALQELLTPTEKIMLAKRLSAVSLLSSGVSSYHVGKALQLSPTTTAKLQEKIESGNLLHTKKLCNILRKGPLWQYLDNLLKPLPRYGTSPSSLFRGR